ncbi:sensor histidine kinase [Streptomyces sulphureus]|uniref:sensor histidine kinase n=1 Tax=Streptomyces sulphureus TaxID=47758 RepID=UPI0003766D87|nr:ATP-binding protein [Streptomyces sulphureus]
MATVVVVVVLGSGTRGSLTYGAALWGVFGSAVLLVGAVLACAVVYARAEARNAVERCAAVRRVVAAGRAEVRAAVQELEQGGTPEPRARAPLPEPGGDAVDLLAHEVALARREAEAAVACAAELAASGAAQAAPPLPRETGEHMHDRVEVFVNLARRLQSLVHREIELLDELEAEVEDPDLLKGLFHVDHLATRVRRHAENLAVLGGAVSRRQWTRPVTMTEVLRSAIAEVEQYPRVKLVPPIEGTLRGHSVADVIHLLAELIENATVFSAPQSQVLLRAQYVTAGLAVEVEDRGLGMTAAEQSRMNSVLADPDRIDVPELLQDGRIGLFVVSALAQRHGIVVQLQSNIYGGVQAVLVVPYELLGEEPESARLARGLGSTQQNAVVQPPGAGGESERPPVEGSSVSADAGTGPLPEQRPTPEPPRPAEPEDPQPPGTAEPLPSARETVHRWAPVVTTDAVHLPEAPGEGAGTPDAARPRLPRRRRQQHLVRELRDLPDRSARATRAEEVADEGHDPGLMAAFRRGTSLAEDAAEQSPGAEAPSGHAEFHDPSPASGGDPARPTR